MKGITKVLAYIMAVIASMALQGCVHEMPEVPGGREVEIIVSHSPEWSFHEHVATRDATAPSARYHFKVTPAGNRNIIVAESIVWNADAATTELHTTLTLPAGEFDIWVWRDTGDSASGESMHYDTSDFASIIYRHPYTGCSEHRDAFRGMASVIVESDILESNHPSARIELERPLASYSFVATDLEEFVEKEIARAEKPSVPELAPILATYQIKMNYTGYMPSRFNNFINRPVDSTLGVSYTSTMRTLSEKEALLAYDHVMVNGHESSIPVQMEVYDTRGQLVSRSQTINVPIVRGRHTIVRGRFLTSKANAGVGINPDFDGEFNIEIR